MPSKVPTEEELINVLTQSGQMDKINAAIKSTMLSALRKTDKYAASFTATTAQKQILADPKGRALLHSIAEFLDVLGYDATAAVFADDSGLACGKMSANDHRKEAEKEFGASAEKKPAQPLLVSLVGRATPTPTPAAAAPTKPVPKVKPPPKSYDTTYEISRWESREFVRKKGEIDGQGMNIDCLKDCKVYIFDHLDSVNVDECTDCVFVIGPTAGSIFFRDCKNITLTAACKQLRTRDCHNMDVRLFAQTDPVVESSGSIRFRPFNAKLPYLTELFKLSKLDPTQNRFEHVYDFTASNDKIPQPHFTVQTTGHGLSMVTIGEGGPWDCPPAIEDLLAGRLKCVESCEKRAPSHDVTKGPSQVAAAVAPTKATPAPKPAAPKPAAPPVVVEDDEDTF